MTIGSSTRLRNRGDFPGSIGMGFCQFRSWHHEASAAIAVTGQSWLCDHNRGPRLDVCQHRHSPHQPH